MAARVNKQIKAMPEPEKPIPLRGGYRKFKRFQVAQLAYRVAVCFCDRHIEKRSRTLVGQRDAPLPKLLLDELRVPKLEKTTQKTYTAHTKVTSQDAGRLGK